MTSFVEDDMLLELERYLRIATEVCIATAFVNFEGVKLLRQFVESTRGTRPFNINFLLDQEFHPHPAARQAIIRELCTIPGARVRVFSDDDRRLHMKVYIFSAGNTVSVITGSHNATGSGLTKNVEASLLTSDHKVVRVAREYFNKYWSMAVEARPNPDAYYTDPGFQPGQQVRLRTTQDYGIVASVPQPELRGRTWYYNVLWTGTGAVVPSEHPENDLQAMTVIEIERPSSIADKLTAQQSQSHEYLRELLRAKLSQPVKNGLFSYMSSRTDIIPYQFKPLMKILNSESYRLLIADEVGLGKTIEAGIIFTEFKARLSAFHRALVVCPTNLKSKWKDEMESRFDEYFQLLTREDFLRALANPEESCYGIISYELLGHDDMIERLKLTESQWDMVILDEAHHLRNKNKRNFAVTHITRRATVLVMLTATPVNLGVHDLTHLLQILLPHDYRDIDDVAFAHRLEPNRYLFDASELVERQPSKALAVLYQMERSCKYAERITSQASYQRIQALLRKEGPLSVQELSQVKDDLVNLNTLAHVISRTRKEDVGAAKPREVVTAKVTFSSEEQDLYEALSDFARCLASSSRGRANSLAVMMPQRQAASCLPAALEYVGDMVRTKAISTHEVVGEIEDVGEEGATHTISSLVALNNARALLVRFSRADIEKNDTKYAALLEFLRTRCVTDGRLDKVIIFTSFRKTLSYLQQRLDADFGHGTTVEIHGDIQPLTERDSRRARFEHPDGPSILLCTEVGSEGLDMQFANKLVNYDLPWNPMRVEQRIGRIDRHGQLADKLLILNFTMSATIEDNVLVRLLERVKVFHDSLGPLNQVIGEVVQRLQDDLLNPNLTEAERDERIRKYEIALQNKARAESRFKETRHQLLGQDKNFTEEVRNVQQNRRYVTPAEIAKVVQIFCAQDPGDTLLDTHAEHEYTLCVRGGAQKRLASSIRNLSGMNEVKRRKHLANVLTGPLHFTTDQAVAVKRKALDFFTLHHPVIAGIISDWKKADGIVAGCFEGGSSGVPAGEYLLYTYYCEYQRKHLPPAVYSYQLAIDLVNGLSTGVGDELYHLIVESVLQPSELRPKLSESLLQRANVSVQSELTRIINRTGSDLQLERETLIRQKAEVLRTASDKEIQALSHQRKFVADNRGREAVTNQIEEKKADLARRLQELSEDPGDIVVKPALVGVAWCLVHKKEG